MDVDQQASQPPTREPASDSQQTAEGSTNATNAVDPNAAAVGHMHELSALLNAAAAGVKAEQAPLTPAATRPKSKKRKQVEGDVPGEDGQAGTVGSPARGGATARGGKAKLRGARTGGGSGQVAPEPTEWDSTAAEAVAMAAQGQEDPVTTDNGGAPQDAVTS